MCKLMNTFSFRNGTMLIIFLPFHLCYDTTMGKGERGPTSIISISYFSKEFELYAAKIETKNKHSRR